MKTNNYNLKNPNCDNDKCLSSNGIVKILPYSRDGNLILCFPCYLHEMHFRIERNKHLSKEAAFPIPDWNNLETYKGT